LPLRPQGLLLLGAVLSGLLPLATLTLGTAGSLEESLDWMLIGTVICALLTLRHDWVELEFRRLGHALPGKQGPTHSPHALMVLGADLMGLGKKYLLSPTAGTLARPLAAYFLGLIATGTVLLSFSFCTRDGTPLDLLDALFTAVSAACVTGLSVIDISQRLSGEGQLVVLVLIQLGAIGIMGMYAVVLLAIGSAGDRKSAAMLEEALGPRIIRMERPNTPEPGSPAVFETLRKDLNEAPKGKGEVPRRPEGLRMLFVIVLVVELIGASVLTLLFHLHGDDWTQAAWRGLFTSISAYCNAGFSLQTDSLIAYQSSPAIMATISLLVIAGSISPFALALLFLKNRRMMSHQLERDLSLRTTGFLLVFGGALISLFEWSSSLAHLGGFEAAVNGFFHGATLRTAGFNSTDMTTLNAATIPLMVGLMFVGGSPGSTAGGAKTTTAALLIAALRAAIAGKTQVEIRKVQIGPGVLYLAIAVMTMNSLLILTGTTALLLTQNLEQGLNPLKLFFEVVSAVNTVGLTMDDTTTALNRMGQQIIVACMFLGRIGPLSLILVLATRARHHEQTPPSRKVRVG